MSVKTLIQIRRGTTSEWSSVNPTLSAGEWGYDTTTKRYKLGDGLTSWNSLTYSAIRPSSSDLIGSSGIGITFAATTGIPVTISVTGIASSQITDFNAAVDSRVALTSVSEEQVQDIVASGNHTSSGFLRNGTGVLLDYNDSSNYLSINVSGYSYTGHTHDDRYYTETELNTGGVGGQVHWANVTNVPTGFTPASHTHPWSQISDAYGKATLNELAYLSGVSAGTASSSRVVVLDINKSITNINSITTTGNLTVGGNVYTSGSFIGSLSGNASTVTNGVYTTDTGTVTSTMIANGTIVNADVNSSAAISYSKLNLSNSILNSDIGSSAVIAYSKLNLSGSILNADINSSAAIAVNKLASSGIALGSTTINLGNTTSVIAGLTSISGVSIGSPTVLANCSIDGGTP